MAKKSRFDEHKAAILLGEVTKTNVTGLKKALNAFERVDRGYSTSRTTPHITTVERDELLDNLLPNKRPRVVGELHDSGVAVLTSKRYAKQLAPVADIIADLDHFRLVGFDFIGRYGMYAQPVYRAYDTKGNSFPFTTVAWQSGGNGPEIMSGNYW